MGFFRGGHAGDMCHRSQRAVATLWVIVGLSLTGVSRAEDGPPVDFRRDIALILQARCLECHGPGQQSAGLRLDARSFAELGGASGQPIIGGTLETNEIYQRVSSDDEGYRMPRFENPLPAEQIDLVRRWVLQGTPWPAAPAAAAAKAPATTLKRVYVDNIRPTFPYLLVVLVLALLTERWKARPMESARAKLAALFVRRVRPSHWLLVGMVLIIVQQVHRTRELQAALDLEQTVLAPRHPLGDPPVPRRPDHPRRLAGTYYRGNCERSEKLYNGGNYRTCTIHIALVDQADRPLQYGDPVPDGGLFVRVKLERSPKTAPQLFSPKIMDGVFLSEQVYTRPRPFDESGVIRLDAVEPDWRWVTRYPVAISRKSESSQSGLVYIYRAYLPLLDGADLTAVPHYGIRYIVTVESGRISEASELWMGAVYVNARVASPPEVGRIPFSSWFDDRPIPEIEGENSEDPELLGIEEHLGE